MNIHAIYIDQFQSLNEFTINLISKYDYSIRRTIEDNSKFQIERTTCDNNFDVFKEYNCKITGITGKNGSGKSTVGLILKNIFSGKPIISNDTKVLIIYDLNGQLYLDDYKAENKYAFYLVDNPVIYFTNSLEGVIVNVSGKEDEKNKNKKWSNIEKKLVYYSNALSEVNDYYLQADKIINLSIDYTLREFIESKREEKRKKDVFGFSNLINDYFDAQGDSFLKMIFKLKTEFNQDSFFRDIIKLPDKIDYYTNKSISENIIDIFQVDKLDYKNLPFFIKLELRQEFDKQNINKVVSEQLKALTILNTVVRRHENKEETVKLIQLVKTDTPFNSIHYTDIDPSIKNRFEKIQEVVYDIEFSIGDDIFKSISVKCDDKAENLYDLIVEINEDLGYKFISFNLNRRFSSGERVLLNLFNSFEQEIESIKSKNTIIFIDEIDQNLHPEWQRSIIYQLLKYFKSRNIIDAHLIFTTHSPFIVSDIPNNHLKSKIGNQFKSIQGEMTFAGNLNDVLFDVMKINSFNGEFTHELINDALDYLNGKPSVRFESDEQVKELIKLIGEPLLKHHLNQMLNLKNQNN